MGSEPTLFDGLPARLGCDGARDDGWMVYSPYLGFWMTTMEPDLVAHYQQQGCLVMLGSCGSDGVVRCYLRGRDPASFPEPQPDEPPFPDCDIVWEYRAAEYSPESYYRGWERRADWLRQVRPDMRPEDLAEQLSRGLGRWAGGYNLEAADMEPPDHRSQSLRWREHLRCDNAPSGNGARGSNRPEGTVNGR